jgi:PHP family Zn ribbon phosphoesterase
LDRVANNPKDLPTLGPNDEVSIIPIDLMLSVTRQQRSECPICFEEFDRFGDYTELTCGHIYHRVCLDQWRKTKNTCPVCRRKIKSGV